MPVFVEEPSELSKARLKSDLIAHNVALPPATSRKHVYVELHARHVDAKKRADFSSDDEDEEPKDAKILDPCSLTDDDLKAALLQHGVKAGPIVASTRALYERKLRNLLLSLGHDKVNGADEAVLYSESEEEEGSEEEQEPAVKEDVQTQTEPADQSEQESSHSEDHMYPQCFLVSSRLRLCATKSRQPSPERNPRNVSKSAPLSGSRASRIPGGISRPSFIDQTPGLAAARSSEQPSVLVNDSVRSSQNFSITEMVEKMEGQTPRLPPAHPSPEFKQSVVQSHWSRSNREPAEEPVQERFKDLMVETPTGIYATRRRPIRGAAGRPVQYVLPDTPLTPNTLERLEVESRLVPLKIQILVFFIVALILCAIFVLIEDYTFNPLVALIDLLNQALDSDETETQEVEGFLEVE